ncbi:MAG: hypothetical protein ACD_20C00033G0005 [uncultured bacterium]|nr:MAG: hypothetical protein ACD_20C00033G0005 [uncultured bacterium]HBH17803.1 hypothetical protein [Cyanobacteria bacterium UBA9579]
MISFNPYSPAISFQGRFHRDWKNVDDKEVGKRYGQETQQEYDAFIKQVEEIATDHSQVPEADCVDFYLFENGKELGIGIAEKSVKLAQNYNPADEVLKDDEDDLVGFYREPGESEPIEQYIDKDGQVKELEPGAKFCRNETDNYLLTLRRAIAQNDLKSVLNNKNLVIARLLQMAQDSKDGKMSGEN